MHVLLEVASSKRREAKSIVKVAKRKNGNHAEKLPVIDQQALNRRHWQHLPIQVQMGSREYMPSVPSIVERASGDRLVILI
jgi:hypothetical protein